MNDDDVREMLRTKADDMRAQHRALKHLDRRPVTIVSDSASDLADTILDRHRIAIVPLQVTFGDESFKDRVELRPADFYARLRTAKPTQPGRTLRIRRQWGSSGSTRSASIGRGPMMLRSPISTFRRLGRSSSE